MLRTLRLLVRLLCGVLVVGFFIAHELFLLRLPVVETLENNAYDLRVRATMPATRSNDIVILDIDEKSLNELGRWPWNRNILARLMDRLFQDYQIRVIGFDMFFAEPDETSGISLLERLASGELKDNLEFQKVAQSLRTELQYDQRFADSLKSRATVLGFVFDQSDARELNRLPVSNAQLDDQISSRLAIPHPKGYSASLNLLQSNAKSGGFFDNPQVDSDGIYRRVPVIQEYQGRLYPSMALEVSRLALNDGELAIGIGQAQSYYAIESVRLGDHIVPVDEHGSVLVPYRGPQGSFRYISVIDVLNKKLPVAALKDKIVILGTSAPGLLDLRSTPVQNIYPGVEVNANIIDGIISGTIKRQPAYIIALQFLILLGIGIVMIILMPRLSPLGNILFTIIILLSVGLVNLRLWQNGIVIPLASPILLTLSLFILHVTYGFLIENRSKRVLARLFGQYIPPELVDEMAKNPDQISLEGQDRVMSVLFSDVRDFTSISESLSSKELAYLMNEYLTPMSRIIHQHRGTIDKYMGDAIMAFWGAPIEEHNHARMALFAALDMLKAVEALEDTFVSRGWPKIRIGIGISTGHMSVGNMGSDFRMAYTVMGDEVNLGSRIESLTKLYGVSLIVSENTRNEVPDFTYLELDRVKVKGKENPVTIYEPIAPTDTLSPEQIEEVVQFNRAVDLYRKRDWNAARALITELKAKTSQQHKVYDIYLDRIKFNEDNPPDANWDGVVAYTSK
ncbi:MAG: adenylate/guanylate cyclase domain-containing protein [Hahellaceae bacterium]|nr:adenylate/guanylate cyclase domain-containing protein [Hahellaceae bacterium]